MHIKKERNYPISFRINQNQPSCLLNMRDVAWSSILIRIRDPIGSWFLIRSFDFVTLSSLFQRGKVALIANVHLKIEKTCTIKRRINQNKHSCLHNIRELGDLRSWFATRLDLNPGFDALILNICRRYLKREGLWDERVQYCKLIFQIWTQGKVVYTSYHDRSISL